ncbi:hypothetical protein AQBE111736_13745 [Aquirufa beregesia]
MTNRVAEPELMLTLELLTANPVAGLKVKVPVPAVPVKVKPKLVKFATPLTKSPAPFNLFVPDNPVTLPVKLEVTVMLFVAALKPVTVLP